MRRVDGEKIGSLRLRSAKELARQLIDRAKLGTGPGCKQVPGGVTHLHPIGIGEGIRSGNFGREPKLAWIVKQLSGSSLIPHFQECRWPTGWGNPDPINLYQGTFPADFRIFRSKCRCLIIQSHSSRRRNEQPWILCKRQGFWLNSPTGNRIQNVIREVTRLQVSRKRKVMAVQAKQVPPPTRL
jgi:hypothetical protein